MDKLIEAQYPGLSPTLQRAARYAIDNPRSIALNSMRASAAEAGLQSSAMHRLARQLGFEGYDDLRTVYREWLGQEGASFSARATALQRRGAHGQAGTLVADMVAADTRSLERMTTPETMAAIAAAHDILREARHIYVVGLRSLMPAAFYFNYACGMFRHNTTLLTGVGGTFADELRRAGPDDALLVFSYEPYARDTVRAVRFANLKGVRVVGVTDSVVAPIAAQAAALIVVGNASPSLFPSVAPALAVAQALAALLLASGGAASLREVEKSEAQLRDFAVYLDEKG
ncbi:MurR/RpiR family transcriptional regulator [Verticiella alkaliphila]|uniref:MurR/RpiR family transcriptional regulator n=1 Tax=Verticiella alkaliphila TaxID=2779529 RepID=UPI00353013C5